MSDAGIVELFFQRSEAALAEAAAKYGRYLGSVAFGIVQDRQHAEECVSDAYLGAWNSIPPHRPAALKAYLARLTRNSAISRLRARGAQKRGGGELPLALEELAGCVSGRSIESELEARRAAELLRGFLSGLGSTERSVFLRRYWYLDSEKAIAARFGFSRSKAASMLHRTRQKLRAMLETEGIL